MPNPKIALALGAGSARGIAHIGVLQVLEEYGIRPDLIVGCSMGAMVGATYVVGTNLNILGQLVCQLRYKSMFDFTFPKMGFISGKKIVEFIDLMTKKKSFADLTDQQFIVVATDLVELKRVIFTEGSIAEAVRASISVPGVFEPVIKDGMVLVDGALIERLPVEVAREQNPDIIIAVDVNSGRQDPVQVNSILDVLMNSIDLMQRHQFQPRNLKVDALIQPEVSHYSPGGFDHAAELIEAGRIATLKAIPKIQKAIKKFETV